MNRTVVGENHGATTYMRLVTPKLPDESNEASRRIIMERGYDRGAGAVNLSWRNRLVQAVPS